MRCWIGLAESISTDTVTQSPKFQQWFQGSKVVDESDAPLLCYHGTRDAVDASRFHPFSHFGTIGAAQDRLLTRKGRTSQKFPPQSSLIPVFLRIRNPITIADLDTHMTPDRIIIAASNQSDVVNQNLKRLWRLPKWRLPEAAAETLLAAGYDGFRYENVVEDVGSTSWIILSPQQVWPLFDSHHTDEIRTVDEYFAKVAERFGGSTEEAKQAVEQALHSGRDIMNPLGDGDLLTHGNAMRLQKAITDRLYFDRLFRQRRLGRG